MNVNGKIRVNSELVVINGRSVIGSSVAEALPTVNGVSFVPVGSEVLDVDHVDRHTSVCAFSTPTGDLLTCSVSREDLAANAHTPKER